MINGQGHTFGVLTPNEQFVAAVQNNDENAVNELLNLITVDDLTAEQKIMALAQAANHGNFALLNHLLEIPAVLAQVTADNNYALIWAAFRGHLDIVNRLLEIPAVLAQVVINDNRALRGAAENGHLALLNRLLDIPAVLAQVTAHKNCALREAASRGHLAIVDRLLEIPEVLAQATAVHNYALRWAAENGHLAMVNRLLEIPEVLAQATADNNYALIWAAFRGHLDIVNRLLEIPAVLAQVTAHKNCALREAASRGHLAIVDRLLEIPAVLAQVAINDNRALRGAAENGHLALLNRLLDIPAVLAQATADNNGALRWAASNGNVDIVNRLLSIPEVLAQVAANDNEAFRGAAGNGHFDIVHRLLDISAVLEQVTADNNGALRSATDNNHQEVVNRLMQIPAVREYVSPAPNLTGIVNGNESSIHGTATEGVAIKQLKERYGEAFTKKGGQKAIIEDLKAYLESQCLQSSLPLIYDAKLSAEKQQIYYKNPSHSAWRYLFCQPNPWLSPEAIFVNRQNGGEGFANIREDHYELMAYIWLAIEEASPSDIPDGFTKEDLKAHFVSELGLAIGRAHNWDKKRKKKVVDPKSGTEKEVDEAYDDGEGDKPTCHMGVTRRLAQCLLTILKPTTPEERPLNDSILKARFRDEFIASTSSSSGCIDYINQLDYSDLKRHQVALENLVVDCAGDFSLLTREEKITLRGFKINNSHINEFVNHCKTYFGEARISSKLTIALMADGVCYNSYEQYMTEHLAHKWFFVDFYDDLSQSIGNRIQILEKEGIELKDYKEEKENKEQKETKENKEEQGRKELKGTQEFANIPALLFSEKLNLSRKRKKGFSLFSSAPAEVCKKLRGNKEKSGSYIDNNGLRKSYRLRKAK